MSWIYLLVAGMFEILWPVGLKLSQQGSLVKGLCIAIGGMALSGVFLWLAQKNIPIGTAYAVWTGIGGAGTFLVGVYFFGDPTSILKYFGVVLVIIGIVCLKLG